MGGYLERQTKDGEYNISAVSAGDFSDGYVRIQPPVSFDTDYLQERRDETGVLLEQFIVGQEATLLFIAGVKPFEGETDKQCVEAALAYLASQLDLVANLNEFKQHSQIHNK